MAITYLKTLDELEKYMEENISYTKIPGRIRQEAQDILTRRCHYLLSVHNHISFQEYTEALFVYWCRLNNISSKLLKTSLYCAILSGDIRVAKTSAASKAIKEAGFVQQYYPDIKSLTQDPTLITTGFENKFNLYIAPSLCISSEIPSNVIFSYINTAGNAILDTDYKVTTTKKNIKRHKPTKYSQNNTKTT